MLEECECETKPDVGDWWDIKMYLLKSYTSSEHPATATVNINKFI